MKLINLVFLIFNGIYYIILSPVLIPIQIYKWSKNRNWRKNIKVGDRCFFINALYTRSYGNITDISEDKLTVRVERSDFNSSSTSWHEINYLRII